MKLIIKETDYGVNVFIKDGLTEELVWSDLWQQDCPEDLSWDRYIQNVFNAGRKFERK